MKTTIFALITIFFGMSIFSDVPNKKITALAAETQYSLETSEPRIDFILGIWTGTGFLTDTNGLEQYVEIEEHNSSRSNSQYQIGGVCKNPGSDFVYTYDKSLFFNKTLNAWYITGKINNNILPDNPITLSENYPLSYSYYCNVNSVRVRYTTMRDTDDSFTETEEKWGQNGWYQTAWFRMTRVSNE